MFETAMIFSIYFADEEIDLKNSTSTVMTERAVAAAMALRLVRHRRGARQA